MWKNFGQTAGTLAILVAVAVAAVAAAYMLRLHPPAPPEPLVPPVAAPHHPEWPGDAFAPGERPAG